MRGCAHSLIKVVCHVACQHTMHLHAVVTVWIQTTKNGMAAALTAHCHPSLLKVAKTNQSQDMHSPPQHSLRVGTCILGVDALLILNFTEPWLHWLPWLLSPGLFTIGKAAKHLYSKFYRLKAGVQHMRHDNSEPI